MLSFVFNKFKAVAIFLIQLIKRIFCCFKKKLNNRGLPITIDGNGNAQDSVNSVEQWDSWDGLSSVTVDGMKSNLGHGMTPVELQIQEYRLNQQRKLTQPPPEPPEEPNYFEELAPKIRKKPQVVILARHDDEQHVSNRVSLSLSDPVLQGSELEEWQEEGGGWEEEAEEVNLDAAIREQREQQRQEKKIERLKRKEEKERNKSGVKLATKLS